MTNARPLESSSSSSGKMFLSKDNKTRTYLCLKRTNNYKTLRSQFFMSQYKVWLDVMLDLTKVRENYYSTHTTWVQTLTKQQFFERYFCQISGWASRNKLSLHCWLSSYKVLPILSFLSDPGVPGPIYGSSCLKLTN